LVLRADRRVVLTFIGNYLPGFNAGGILRSLVNTIDHLGDEFEFSVVTKDRDIGDTRPYASVRIGQWQRVGNANVFYLPPESLTLDGLKAIINATPHDALYLISFFDRFTINVLLLRLLGRVKASRFIVAPRGEFGWGSLRLKYAKKLAFITVAKLIGLYRGVTWHASTAEEALDIARIMNVPPESVHVALDLPAKAPAEYQRTAGSGAAGRDEGGLRVVFLSRIAREKNLDYALKVLRGTKSRIVFDIYGPLEDARYWDECQQLIPQLPANVVANYRGGVSPNEVVNVFSRYDLFFLPTSGENYGHVIAESLTAGTPVLISTESPWRGLQAEGLGWDITLARPDAFIEALEAMASRSATELQAQRTVIRAKAAERLTDAAAVEANRVLFRAPDSHRGAHK
jgi:glycosyltransferase involved in cell wall biosynthesis